MPQELACAWTGCQDPGQGPRTSSRSISGPPRPIPATSGAPEETRLSPCLMPGLRRSVGSPTICAPSVSLQLPERGTPGLPEGSVGICQTRRSAQLANSASITWAGAEFYKFFACTLQARWGCVRPNVSFPQSKNYAAISSLDYSSVLGRTNSSDRPRRTTSRSLATSRLSRASHRPRRPAAGNLARTRAPRASNRYSAARKRSSAAGDLA
jgi:hypothetical protein